MSNAELVVSHPGFDGDFVNGNGVTPTLKDLNMDPRSGRAIVDTEKRAGE